jgi:hypothetical protein
MKHRINHPPGLRGIPLFGSQPELLRDPLGFFERCASYGSRCSTPPTCGSVRQSR